eukprot:48400-Chlamydomonas_euryale.AAC.2
MRLSTASWRAAAGTQPCSTMPRAVSAARMRSAAASAPAPAWALRQGHHRRRGVAAPRSTPEELASRLSESEDGGDWAGTVEVLTEAKARRWGGFA